MPRTSISVEGFGGIDTFHDSIRDSSSGATDEQRLQSPQRRIALRTSRYSRLRIPKSQKDDTGDADGCDQSLGDSPSGKVWDHG